MESLGFENKNKSLLETYIFANYLILLIILLLFSYLLFTKLFNTGFGCQYKLIFGSECRSCGLTRGLQSCLSFDFSTANKFNAQSTFVFILIISQIIFRISLALILKNKYFTNPKNTIKISILDVFIIVSLLIFNLKYYG